MGVYHCDIYFTIHQGIFCSVFYVQANPKSIRYEDSCITSLAQKHKKYKRQVALL